MTDNFVSGRELARRLAIDEKMVRKYVASGLFKPLQSGPRSGKFDAERCAHLYAANRDPDGALRGLAAAASIEGAGRGLPENSLTKARTASAVLDARERQLRLAKLEGKLIDRDDARRACLAVVIEIRTRLDNLPAMAAPVANAAPSVAEAEQLLRGMVRALMIEVAKLGEAV